MGVYKILQSVSLKPPLLCRIVPECHTANQNERFICTQLFPPGENGGTPIKQRQTQGARLNPSACPRKKNQLQLYLVFGKRLVNTLNTYFITLKKKQQQKKTNDQMH